MNPTRKITLIFHEDFQDASDGNWKQVYAAIGYLVSWAITNERYQECKICGCKNGDLSALYMNGNKLNYEILAQRQEDGSFSFHS